VLAAITDMASPTNFPCKYQRIYENIIIMKKENKTSSRPGLINLIGTVTKPLDRA
jgi:hypothetical protein